MSKHISADSIKPHYDQIKEIWSGLLDKYYSAEGVLDTSYLVDVSCPHCNSNVTHSKFCLNGFYHVTCSDCEVVYVTPRLKASCLEELYSSQYYAELYMKSMIPAFKARKQLIGQNKAQQVVSVSKIEKGRVLDIGCGVGEVIDVFKDNGWECQVIEVNPVAIEWLKSRQINVYDGFFDQYPEKEKFDVIMAWGVIEHLVDPDKFLKKVFNHLRPGGVFVSEVPNGQSILIDYCRNTLKDPKRIIMGEQHIILYSMKAYEDLHQRHGFHKLHLQTNGLDIETIMKVENQLLPANITMNLQKCIDSYCKGDLIRGFWRK